MGANDTTEDRCLMAAGAGPVVDRAGTGQLSAVIIHR